MIRTIIIDDEPLAVQLLKGYVEKTESLQLLYAGGNVFEALKLVQENKADLVLLDIQMPELTGIQFLKIAGEQCRVILTTAYSEYALEGYEYNVADYLLKPFSYDRFRKAIDKVLNSHTTIASLQEEARPDHFFIKSEYKLVRVNFDEILYIESLRDYIALHVAGKQKILSLESLRNMEALLPADNFLRVHKSYIVALNKISFVERSRIVISEAYIPIGDSYSEAFFKRVQA
ncbi:MAG: LytTR family DNA-binding domain-containing protein [Ferruginibacter sp.]